MRRVALALLLLAAAAGATWVGLGRSAGCAAPPPERAQRGRAPAPSAAPVAAVTPLPMPEATGAEVEARLELPDGTSVAALNGATGELSLAPTWGTRPWSPIVGVERSDAGVDWYVHADGTRTTTEMKWRADLGRLDAVTRMAEPREGAPPVDPRR